MIIGLGMGRIGAPDNQLLEIVVALVLLCAARLRDARPRVPRLVVTQLAWNLTFLVAVVARHWLMPWFRP
jgi:hypothetical protein